MSCNTSLTSILRSCDNNIGGLKAIYIAPAEFVTGTTLSAGVITAIGMSAGTSFVEYQFNKNSASYVEDGVAALEAGSTLVTTTTILSIPRRDAAKSNSIRLIAGGQRNLVLILKDANDIFWYQGYSNYANLTAFSEGSGAAKADGSKYSLTFLSEEPTLMYEVNSGIIANLI